MRKVILSLAVLVLSASAIAQVSCTVLSPGSIAGNLVFEWADPAGGDWATPDFTVPNTNVQGFLALAEDGTAGTATTPDAHLLTNEACSALINNTDMNPNNDMTGKIAILYRGTCQFGTKALNAQNAGAIAVVMINHSGDPVGMAGGNDGTSVTIPVVMISTMDGEAILNELANGPVEMFLGNKQNLHVNDMGGKDDEYIVSDFGGAHSAIYDGFTPGLQVYNFGSADNAVIVTATIDGPGTSADYTSSIGPITILSGDTLSIFDGNPESFNAWNLGIGNYPAGEYTLTYDVVIDGVSDDDIVDNNYVSTFWVNNEVISLSNLDGSNMPVANTYPFNSDSEYKACMMFQEANASTLAARGLYFVPYSDTTTYPLEGAEYIFYAYEWNDTWVDVTNPGFTSSFSEYVTDLSLVTAASYVVNTNNEAGTVRYSDFDNPFILVDNQRYLFCIEPTGVANGVNEISIGYDKTIDYGGNYGIYLQPISPVFVDATWYTGWSGTSAPSIGLRTMSPASVGLAELANFSATAYPNPAKDAVKVSVSDKGMGTLVVTDLAGKAVYTSNVDLTSGNTTVNIASFESGMYIFNVTMENGAKAQFNVVKN